MLDRLPYYKCHGAKNKKGCKKKPVKKEWIENFVVQQTMMIVMDGPLMERITDKLLDLQGEENHDLRLLEQQLSEVEKGIENMLNAIQAGIITESTKQRLSDLEQSKSDLEEHITENRIQHPALTREQIAFFLDQFKATDINDEEQRQRLIDSFVNAVYVYEDKIVLIFNYKGGTKAVNLNDINSSDLEASGPSGKSLETVAFQGFFFLIFGIDHLRTGGAGDQTRHGLGARELCYFGGSMSACVSIRFPITIPPDAVLTGSCIRGYFVTVRFSCPGSMSRDGCHGPMRSGEGLVPRIFDGSLGPRYPNIVTEMGTFRGAIIPEQVVLNPPYPDK